MSDITELKNFFQTGKAGDVQECKTQWFEALVKGPLKKAIISLLTKYPEPTTNNCTKPNALAWINLKKDYLAHEQHPEIIKMATLFFNIIIDSYEHDPPYEERIDTVGEMIADAYQSGKFIRRSHPLVTFWKKE